MILEAVIGGAVVVASYAAGRMKASAPKPAKRPKCSAESENGYRNRCEAIADPRCVADNCTKHCKQYCRRRCEG